MMGIYEHRNDPLGTISSRYILYCHRDLLVSQEGSCAMNLILSNDFGSYREEKMYKTAVVG